VARPRKTTRRTTTRRRQPKRILNVEPSPKTDEDWTFETATEADMVMAAPSIPASKDLRATWWGIADQGSTGSCVGWACADSLFRWNWRIWLATNGPILTRLNVDDTWYKATVSGGDLPEYLPDTARGGHAVALVGFDSGRFIVRNSWGTDWGDGGFAYASLAYAQEAFTEAYGVVV
jgi:C1A family cysteine protease